MSRFFAENLENQLMARVKDFNFHTSNYEVAETVSPYFTNKGYLQNFSEDFLDSVHDTLIDPAQEFGYYHAEENGMYRTSSAIQYDGDDDRFKAACLDILNAIDEERTRRLTEALETFHIDAL